MLEESSLLRANVWTAYWGLTTIPICMQASELEFYDFSVIVQTAMLKLI